MMLHITHETIYRYAEPVRYAMQALRLTPRTEARQHVVSWTIGTPGRRVEQRDSHGNVVHYLTVEAPHRELRLRVKGVVQTDDRDGQPNPAASLFAPLVYRASTALTAANAELVQFARDSFPASAGVTAQVLRGAEAVAARVTYMPGTTQVSDTAASAFARQQGVCQDQAHVFIACCRVLGLPARYVSGYLFDRDAHTAASHAWAEVWDVDAGHWYGIDITHGRPTAAEHCRLAVGRDYLDAAPVRGVRRGGGAEKMDVEVLVSDSTQQ
jgi:transglutaminase-like putative cysteine protease